MANSRTPLSDLRLQGGHNLRRALAREKNDANPPPLTDEKRDEIEQVSELIQLAFRAARKGSTVNGQKNPAYEHISVLVKTRELLSKGKKPKKSAKETLADIDALLANPVAN
jgi:hypothetical protein